MSVVIPAYNEEAGIAQTVEAVRDWLSARGDAFEVVVVDNASEDRTVERAESMADGTRVRVLRNDSNRGKGHSVRRGMLEATGTLRLHCDADCAPSLPSLPKMLDLIEDSDVVAGSRLAEGAAGGRRPPPGRARG